MITAAAAAFLVGTGIGLHSSRRAAIAAIAMMVAACIACAAIGWITPLYAAIEALAVTTTLLAGYAALTVVRGMYEADARDMVAAHHVVSSASVSGSPSRP